MKIKYVAFAGIGLFVAILVLVALLPKDFVERAKREEMARNAAKQQNLPAQPPRSKTPPWVKSMELSGDVLIITMDTTDHWPGLLAGGVGHQILRLSSISRNGIISIPDNVKNILIYANVDLINQDTQETKSETVIRSFFTKPNFLAAIDPPYNHRTVFKLASHTSETAVSKREDLLKGLCLKPEGSEYGDLCT